MINLVNIRNDHTVPSAIAVSMSRYRRDVRYLFGILTVEFRRSIPITVAMVRSKNNLSSHINEAAHENAHKDTDNFLSR
jgi:hypothetical protein